MTKLAANLTMLFNEVDFLDRFGEAARAGFKGVEFLFPYAFEAGRIAEQLDKHRLQLVLHNLPAGNWEAGERGIACDPARKGEFQDGVGKAIAYAKALGVKQLNCLVGIKPASVHGRPGLHQRGGKPALCSLAPGGRADWSRDRTDQHLRHPRLLFEWHRAGAGHHRRDGLAQHQGPVRHLSHAAHGGRTGQHHQGAPGADRPHPAGRQSRAASSRARARSITATCCRRSMRWATRAGSAASTSRRTARPMA